MCLVLMALADKFACRCGLDGVLLILSIIYRAFDEFRASDVALFWDESEYVTLGKVETQEERDKKTEQRHGKEEIDAFEAGPGRSDIGYGPLALPWDLFTRDRDRRRRVFRWFAEKVIEHLGVPQGKSVIFDKPPGFSHPVVALDDGTGKRIEPFRSGVNPKIGESDFKSHYYIHSVFPGKNALIYSVDADTVSISLLESGYRLASTNSLATEVWIKSMDQEERFEIDDEELLSECEKRGWHRYVKLEKELKMKYGEGPRSDAFSPENAYERKFFACKHEEFIDANALWRARIRSYPKDRASFLASEMFVILLTGNDMSGSSCLPAIGEMWLFELWMEHRDQIGPLLKVDPRMYIDESAEKPVPDFVAAWRLVRLAYQRKLWGKVKHGARGDELLPYSTLLGYGPIKVGKHTLQMPSVDEVRLLFARTMYSFAYYSTGWGGGDKEPDVLSSDHEGRSLLGWQLVDPSKPRERSNVRIVKAKDLSHALVDGRGPEEPVRVRFVKQTKKQFDDAEASPFSGIKRIKSSRSE